MAMVTRAIVAPYCGVPGASGLLLGYTVYDESNEPFQTGALTEILQTGIYTAFISLDDTLAWIVVSNSPVGIDPYVREIDASA